MKITATVKDAMIGKLTTAITTKLSVEEFNAIFYELNLHHSNTKLFPYRVFKEFDTLDAISGIDEEDTILDKSFIEYLNLITTNVVAPFDRGRKLVKVLKNIQLTYGDTLPYNLCTSTSLVVLLNLFTSMDSVLNDIKYQVMSSKIYYLKKYILLLLYIDRLKLKDTTDAILIEFLTRDAFIILDMDIGVFKDE